MDGNPKGDQQVAREAKGELKERGLSRRGLLNVDERPPHGCVVAAMLEPAS